MVLIACLRGLEFQLIYRSGSVRRIVDQGLTRQKWMLE